MDTAAVLSAIENVALAVAAIAVAYLLVQSQIFMWRSIFRRMLE